MKLDYLPLLNKMNSSKFALTLTLGLLLVSPYCSATKSSSKENKNKHSNPKPITLKYHHGPVLNGNLTLSIVWYTIEPFEPVVKTSVRSFIGSLKGSNQKLEKPDVSIWLEKVESYLSAAKIKESVVNFDITREDNFGSMYGSKPKVINSTNIYEALDTSAGGGDHSDIVVIFAGKDMIVEDGCKSTCYRHGVMKMEHKKQVYIIVPNPKQCPKICGAPFDGSKTLHPPSGNVEADTFIFQFASAFAETVTNPYNTGFHGGKNKAKDGSVEVAKACQGSENIKIDLKTHVAYNVHGINGTKFLLPALWDLKESSCWSPK